MARGVDQEAADNLGLRHALRALRRLINGERLRVGDLTGESAGGVPAVRRRLNALLDELPWMQAEGGGQGRTQWFRWVWPKDRDVHLHHVRALAVARTVLEAFRESEVGVVLTDLLEDHIRRLGAEHAPRDEFDRMFFVLSRFMNPQGVRPENLDKIAQAIVDRRAIDGSYAQFDGTVHRVVIEPWTLVFANEGPYVYGRCVESEQADQTDTMRVFNAARLDPFVVTRRTFAYPVGAEYSPRKLFEHSFSVMLPAPNTGEPKEIVLRFDRSMGSYFERHRIHPTQEGAEVLRGGAVRVRLRLHVTYDLVHWIRGHGKTVRVEAPDNLRQWVDSRRGGDGYRTYVMEWNRRATTRPQRSDARRAGRARRDGG